MILRTQNCFFLIHKVNKSHTEHMKLTFNYPYYKYQTFSKSYFAEIGNKTRKIDCITAVICNIGKILSINSKNY